jgi:hypothetical protein|tara:strand:- start:15 stop:368 length:354 start_codon:yes stop_codon:yes gene_type:complete
MAPFCLHLLLSFGCSDTLLLPADLQSSVLAPEWFQVNADQLEVKTADSQSLDETQGPAPDDLAVRFDFLVLIVDLNQSLDFDDCLTWDFDYLHFYFVDLPPVFYSFFFFYHLFFLFF